MPSTSQTYEEALRYLYDRVNYERATDHPYNRANFRLSRMERLLVELQNPQQACPIIHVAGSKGKGSVAWLTAESLRRAGYRTGLYTSPHISRLEERFVVDGKVIDQGTLIQAVTAVKSAARTIEDLGHGSATFFELTTAMAWWIFREQHVRAAVVEVGLGGRLDSTNICWPAISIITSISYDHQAQLGDTLAEIAYEKAGIIKPGVPVVSGAVNHEAAEVIQRIARERGSILRQLNRDFTSRTLHCSKTIDSTTTQVKKVSFNYLRNETLWPSSKNLDGLSLGLIGEHQVSNACVTLAALDVLREHGWHIGETAVREAIAKTMVPGRIQVLSNKPWLILDTAHNEASIEALIRALDDCFPPLPKTMIFAASRDKKWRKMLGQILPAFDRLILTQFHYNPRAVPVDQLLNACKEWLASQVTSTMSSGCPTLDNRKTIEVLSETSIQAAYALAQQKLGQDEMLVIAGSFFLAAEFLEILPQAD